MFFHFAQAVYRKVQALGLTPEYNAEESMVKSWTHSAISIAYVPPQDVEESFTLLNDQLNLLEDDDVLTKMEDLSDYLKETYISGRPAGGRRRAVPPRFSPNSWNVYGRTLNREGRTNNAVEGYHNRLNKMVNRHHVSMFALLEELRKEQSDVEASIVQLQAGHGQVRQNKSKKADIRENRILNIVQRYQEYKDNNDITTYLRSLGYNKVPRT